MNIKDVLLAADQLKDMSAKYYLLRGYLSELERENTLALVPRLPVPNPKIMPPRSHKAKEILEYISEHPYCRNHDICMGLEISKGNLRPFIMQLMTDGIIAREGSGPTTGYFVTIQHQQKTAHERFCLDDSEREKP